MHLVAKNSGQQWEEEGLGVIGFDDGDGGVLHALVANQQAKWGEGKMGGSSAAGCPSARL